jgi:hypothetical protein
MTSERSSRAFSKPQIVSCAGSYVFACGLRESLPSAGHRRWRFAGVQVPASFGLPPRTEESRAGTMIAGIGRAQPHRERGHV